MEIQSHFQRPTPSFLLPLLRTSPRLVALSLLISTLAASMLLTIIALNTKSRYNPYSLERFKLSVLEFHQCRPWLPACGILISFAMLLIWLPLGVLSAIPCGVYAGCRLEAEQNIKLNQPSVIKPNAKEPNSMIALH